MVRKQNHPEIKLREWLKVEGTNCVITQIYARSCLLGVCEVVSNPNAPVNCDVYWDGQQWIFTDRPGFVNAAVTSRLDSFVAILRQGQGNKLAYKEGEQPANPTFALSP